MEKTDLGRMMMAWVKIFDCF